jgi:hypothetical protein
VVVEISSWVCELCKKEHSTEDAAIKCEARGIIRKKHCYDLHTKLILCAHAKKCMHLEMYGHIETSCNEFHETKAKPSYYKGSE